MSPKVILGDLESPRLQNINIERLSKFPGVPVSQIFAKNSVLIMRVF